MKLAVSLEALALLVSSAMQAVSGATLASSALSIISTATNPSLTSQLSSATESATPPARTSIFTSVGFPTPVSSSIVPPESGKPDPLAPPGGLNTNGTLPFYHPLSDFDFQSLNLALNQEWIELDLFHHGLAQFSDEEFAAAGINAEERALIAYMGNQEIGHARLIQNMLGPNNSAKPCTYQYPFTTVREFLDFSQQVTRWGEAGTIGFIPHLNSRDSAQMLLQTVTTEARQQMAFRQLEGLFPMPVDFQTGITQSMTWTLLAPHLVSCPAENPRINWQNFPALNVTNAPDPTPLFNNTSVGADNSTSSGNDTTPAITHNSTNPLSFPGREVFLSWELPGKTVGPNNSYNTTTAAGPAKFAAWISQLNTTYTLLTDVNGTTAKTTQPSGFVLGDGTSPIFNGTLFILVTDANVTVTPSNVTAINPHIVAGPAVYTAG
ncbi:Protein rds1 [Psilocybe cubensis]|uniref:Protein rds1 n=2 Tax=Psilocybe cubensis TaxID=181762 RepID=A0ACB8GQ12_PSICU|nr:Protein rds1 [Psilocybe cubensis]KAH9477311.1 Protein rds1 [Psilocybe cubensis]